MNDQWDVKAWPMPGNDQRFRHAVKLSHEAAMNKREQFNSQGYGVVAVVRHTGRTND